MAVAKDFASTIAESGPGFCQQAHIRNVASIGRRFKGNTKPFFRVYPARFYGVGTHATTRTIFVGNLSHRLQKRQRRPPSAAPPSVTAICSTTKLAAPPTGPVRDFPTRTCGNAYQLTLANVCQISVGIWKNAPRVNIRGGTLWPVYTLLSGRG